MMVHVFYRTVPALDAPAILGELLAANFHLDAPGEPAFGVDPRSRELVLRYAYPLEAATGASLLNSMQRAIDSALQWRAGHPS